MKNLFLLCCSLFTVGVLAQDVDCEKFRTGKFKYEDPAFGLVVVKREEDKQVMITAEKAEIHSSIKWVGGCKYVLTHTKVVKAEMPELIGEKLYVEIIEDRGNRYICRATTENGFGGEIEVLKMN